MGVHNRITAEKYKQLKEELHTPADDAAVSKRFGVSRTTCRMVRNTDNYAQYCERRFRYHGNPKSSPTRPQEAVGRAQTLNMDDEGPRAYGAVIVEAERQNAVEREMAAASATIRVLLFIMLAFIIALVALVVWRFA